MLKLKDVSKFYYNKGVISTGFNKVSAEFNLGEFVIITGESGSGKSTLLNVLSGTDSYEEGEMYINGDETSHYSEIEFEDYRKKYIGNIFQNFNLINSYTVYQNIELVLLINGYKKNDITEKINLILKEVDLYKFRKTKVSKLSGGQKQRVAIARALAKETPIIIADEPTGNLDSRSAARVLAILHKISTNKLVIIVTHNYAQVEKYATRRIKMHDGKIIEDKSFLKPNNEMISSVKEYKNISKLNTLRLAIRNTFNIIPKFLLIFFVYFFISSSLIAEYTSFKKAEYENSKVGYNSYFQEIDDKRIIIQKKDKTYFTNIDYENVKNLPNVDYIVEDDLLLDNLLTLTDKNSHLFLNGSVKDINKFNEKLDLGRMPTNDNEIIIEGRKNDYYISNMSSDMLNTDLKIEDNMSGSQRSEVYKIVGIKYNNNNNSYGEYKFYADQSLLKIIKEMSDLYYSSIEVSLSKVNYKVNNWESFMQITPNDNVPLGKAYISSELNYTCLNYNCINKKIKIKNTNIYYETEHEFIVSKTYTKGNFTGLTKVKDYENNNGRIYINPEDYKNLFNLNFFQSSVFVKNIKEIEKTNLQLQDLNYKTLLIKDTLVNWNEGGSQFLRIFQLIVTIMLIGVMFFISYFIIKIVLKSRNIYFTTIRVLGASKKTSKKLLDIELFIIINLAFITIISFILLNTYQVLKVSYIQDLINYINYKDYILIYLILIIMSQLISSKFSKSIFKKSAMKTFNEVV